MDEGPVEHAAGRGMVQGMAIGFVIVAGITLGIMVNAGAAVVPALGVAAFAGFWGGPGFGGMLGATIAAVRAEEDSPSIPAASVALNHLAEEHAAHRSAA